MARASGRKSGVEAPEAPTTARRRSVPKAKTVASKTATAPVKTPGSPAKVTAAATSIAAPPAKIAAAAKVVTPRPGPRPAAPRRRETPAPGPLPEAAAVAPAAAATAVQAAPVAARLTEEEQIESAKYLPREMPPRLFEEERFLFPETYGVNRVRLLVKDPEWLFAHWDFDPSAMASLRASLGERAMAVSSLTLRISDPANGGSSVIYLPTGARSWYVRTDSARRSYRAELGVTLPSGEFRSLATSNTVSTPRTGPSPERARRTMSYKQAGEINAAAAAAVAAEQRRDAESSAGPWTAPPEMGSSAENRSQGPAASGGDSGTKSGAKTRGKKPERGGASDTYRR